MPIRVKFLTKNKDEDVSSGWRQFLPHGSPIVGNCKFLFHREERNYDWLVVYDDLPTFGNDGTTRWSEKLDCPRSQTLLITTEPSSIKTYGRSYTRQFGWVLTSQEPWALRHPNTIFRQAGLIRFYQGDHDELVAHPPEEKTLLISTVCSSKQQSHTLHHTRYSFTQKLKKALPELEIFGHGVRPIERKNEALDAFRYHVAIENHYSPHHWTEKLADSFLGLCLPFYFGCPNATDYFPAESFIPIDITRFDESLDRIRTAIANDEYTRRLPAIREARRLVLEEYGTFPQLARLIAERNPTETQAPEPGARLLSRHNIRASSPREAIAMAVEKTYIRARNAIARPLSFVSRPSQTHE